MPELRTDDTTLHYEVEGSGEPVTVFAHGLTNSCMELAAFTPFAPGTKVRFCFRGHGHSGVPEAGSYRFADFARDLDDVARATGATNVVGTSLGAGAVLHLVGREPARFDRIVLLLPATLDMPIGDHSLFDRTADLLETLPRDQAIEAILRESGRTENHRDNPGLRAYDMLRWREMDPVGVARAIREITRDVAIDDGQRLRDVAVPTMIIAREGDPIHPAVLARVLSELMPQNELVMLESEDDLIGSIPVLVERVSRFLTGVVR